jgi:hypothetical protein
MRALAALRRLPELRAESRPVGIARIGVGIAALLEALEISYELADLSDPGVLRMPRFDFVPTLTESSVGPFLGIWVLLALAFAAGFRPRVAGLALAGMFTYVLALDHQLYSNHLYLMTLLTSILALGNSGAALSLDSRRRGVRPLIEAWPVALIRVLVSIVYGFAAASKLNLIFLSGLVLRVYMKLPGIESIPSWVFSLFALGAVGTEIFLAVAFWRPRLRRFAVVVGIAFHLLILATMQLVPDLITFGLLMGSAYLAFFTRIVPATEPARAEAAVSS